MQDMGALKIQEQLERIFDRLEYMERRVRDRRFRPWRGNTSKSTGVEMSPGELAPSLLGFSYRLERIA